MNIYIGLHENVQNFIKVLSQHRVPSTQHFLEIVSQQLTYISYFCPHLSCPYAHFIINTLMLLRLALAAYTGDVKVNKKHVV